MRKNTPATVIIAISASSASGRDCLAGIFRFLNEGNSWRIQLFDSPTKLTPDAVREARGIITESSVPQTVLSKLEERQIPVVLTDHDTCSTHTNTNIERLQLDDRQIGAEAFRFFSALGNFGSFAFITDAHDKKWSADRESGFREAAELNRKTVVSLTSSPEGANARDDQSLALKLKRLPKPVAIFSSWDKMSLHAFNICTSAKLDVPRQAAILGVDNDEILCRGVTPNLSSILPNHEMLGYMAAKELRRLLNGGKSKEAIVIKNAVREIFNRESTRIVQPAEHIIRNAKTYILQHAAENITPRDVVRHLGVSRTLVDLRFRELNAVSLRQQIALARIGEIKRRLITTKDSLSQIARACGFTGSPALSRYFKREAGMTPNDWRKGHPHKSGR